MSDDVFECPKASNVFMSLSNHCDGKADCSAALEWDCDGDSDCLNDWSCMDGSPCYVPVDEYKCPSANSLFCPNSFEQVPFANQKMCYKAIPGLKAFTPAEKACADLLAV